MTKRMSNRLEVVEDTPPEERDSSALDLSRLVQGSQRALGCFWRPDDDVLSVRYSEVDVPASKRGVLKRVSMVFHKVIC